MRVREKFECIYRKKREGKKGEAEQRVVGRGAQVD